MCGLYGIVSFTRRLQSPEVLDGMGRALKHRGPDDHLMIVEPDAALGTERLRITDLRPEGAQPFTDPASRVWLSCNGAIYNADALRRRYPDYPYRSSSDVEPLVPLYLERGVEGLQEIDGMFAIAVWDARARRLILARDRAGEKPLFYSRAGSEIWFASEVQALLTHGRARSVDPQALHDYLRFGYVLQPRTMFREVRKIEAGTALTFTDHDCQERRYWVPEAISVEAAADDQEQRLERLLEASVRKQLRADVPLGVFTSGGVDSALLAALAAREVPRGSLHTFTVGFPDASFDERPQAARAADILGTRHHEVCAQASDLAEAFDAVAERVAEPIADPAILPTWLLAKAARDHVGVVLSGEGADELFGGYPTYLGHLLAPHFARLPAGVRSAIASLVELVPPSQAKVPLEYLVRRFVAHAHRDPLDRHCAWFGTGLPAEISQNWPEDQEADCRQWPPVAGLSDLMLFDYRTYLPDDLLTKVDRATMLASLEARSPYLDRDLTTFALALDPELKLRHARTKWILKRVAERYLPRAIVHRKKRGLSVPVGTWLNGGLQREADRLLAPERLAAGGLVSPGTVSRLLYEHRRGQANHARGLWAVMVLERWRERWIEH